MATFQLATKFSAPLSMGCYLVRPGQIVSDTSIQVDNPEVQYAIAQGNLVFADGTNITTYLQDPVVKGNINFVNRLKGTFISTTTNNVYGA